MFSFFDDVTNQCRDLSNATTTLTVTQLTVKVAYNVLGPTLADRLCLASDHAHSDAQKCMSGMAEAFSRKFSSLSRRDAEQELRSIEERFHETALRLPQAEPNDSTPSSKHIADCATEAVLLLETVDQILDSVLDLLQVAPSVPKRLPECMLQGLEERMVSNGWCPNHVKMCWKSFGLSALVYASRIARPHQRVHTRCSADQCVAYNVDEDRRVTKHIRAGCVCPFTAASRSRTVALLQAGRIPLVRLVRDADGTLRINIQPFEIGQEFLAISHVWSHGLANGVGNSLPVCQLRRILQWARVHVKAPHLFWLDTLCVPRAPLPLRRQAIEGIRKVYEVATRVLVLDEELLASPLAVSNYQEKLMRINLSGWMRRVWTLHETVRAQQIHFQFADGYCTDLELIDQYKADLDTHKALQIPFYNVVASRAVSLLQNTAALRHESAGATRMARVWSLLRWRHLSWPEDETIMMANMLGLNPEAVSVLLRTRKHMRMRHFLDLFSHYPAALLFLQVPKLQVPGKRWAPASWLHCVQHLSGQLVLDVQLVALGLSTKHGLVLSCPYITLRSCRTDSFYSGRSNYLLVSNLRYLFAVKGCGSHRYLTRSRNKGAGTKFALCLEHLLTPQMVCCRAALVAVSTALGARGERIKKARFVRNVQITPIGSSSKQPSTLKCATETNRPHFETFEGRLAADAATWCIG